ncbi:MAG: hypothetical protein C0480_02925 [Bradyrhizobium sp.]|nr:hypothetical protein [Bradyrhizobium sp.]
MLKVNRRRNRLPCLPDDIEGRDFLKVLVTLDPDLDIGNLAPWVTALELHRIRKAARCFKPTEISIGHAIKLTDAEREAWQIWNIRPCDVPWEVVQRRRAKDKNDRRRKRRQTEQARLQARGCDPREAAVLAVIERLTQRPGPTVIYARAIMDGMQRAEREAFPTANTSFRVIVHRVLGRLVKGGTLTDDLRLRGPLDNAQRFVTPTPTAKSLIHRGLAVTDRDTGPREVHEAEGLDADDPKGLAEVEVLATAGPHRASSPVVAFRIADMIRLTMSRADAIEAMYRAAESPELVIYREPRHGRASP